MDLGNAAEERARAVSERQTQATTDDQAHHRAGHAGARDFRRNQAGQGKREHRHRSDDPCLGAGWRHKDRDHRQRRTGQEGQRREERRRPRAGQLVGINAQLQL